MAAVTDTFIQALVRIEGNFNRKSGSECLWSFFPAILVVCVLYVAFIFTGRRWMQDKQPFDLRRELTMWNTGLAVFSILGFLNLTPAMLHKLFNEGYLATVCSPLTGSHVDLWKFLFCLSKAAELGDTVFLVLRKSQLTFLHCYHHLTVLIYAWYGGTLDSDPLGNWFGWMNYGVHSVMYMYFVLKSIGFWVPNGVSRAITLLQLSQFLMGLVAILTAVWVKMRGHFCPTSDTVILVGIALYGSYFALFVNFFYNRYFKKKKKD